MKKCITILLILVIVCSLCACGSSAPPEPTPEPTPNPKEVLYDKYADIIDALEAEDYDAAAKAVEARRPAPEVTEVEITMDNLWDYFEIVEDRDERTDANGNLTSLSIFYILSLKESYTCANRNEYNSDIAVGYEYDQKMSLYDIPCEIDFESFTCSRESFYSNDTHESKMAHYPQQPFMYSQIAVNDGKSQAQLTIISNLEILNASGTLYLENN